jgi:hypothetical protein
MRRARKTVHAAGAKAGSSAQSVYETQRKAWIDRNRRVFRILDAITALVIIASIVLWQAWQPSGWCAGLLAGMALCFNLSARLNPPTWIEQWQSGAFGEQRTARELSKLGDDWLVVHDLQRRNGANIDHVLVGPPGVYLLDSKNIGTEVRIDRDELTALRPDGRQRYRERTMANKARGAAAALSRALTTAESRCWVNAVLVVWGDMPEPHVASTNLDWVAGAELVNWLNNQPSYRIPDRLVRVKHTLMSGTLEL